MLIVVSALDTPLGLPTCVDGVLTLLGVGGLAKRSPLETVRSVSWTVLPLVGGLFVLVEALERTGVIAAVMQAAPPRRVVDGLLIGVDLGPNLSITGSLATILRLQAIRREGEDVGFWRFLTGGAVTMVPALAAALGVRLLSG